jgi:putative tryptophan/tyrosine transport system substrate-binding protein
MSRKTMVVWLVALALAPFHLTEAQQQAKVAKIGWLGFRSAFQAPGTEVSRREFRALGYVEGKNIAFEYRDAEGKPDRLPAVADELVRLKVDIIVTASTVGALAAKNATRTIPIVFYSAGDPVATGLVDSLARPGGNITGSPSFRRCWLANDWSYSRKPFPSSPAWPCCGIHRIQSLHNNGKRANSQHENWVSNFIPWR